jgi:hypothetical protein
MNEKPMITDVINWTDEEINALTKPQLDWLEYGIEYFDFGVAGICPTQRHLDVMKKLGEMISNPASVVEPQPIGKLCSCGHYDPHPMSTALGSSCCDCYDRMSD